MIFLYILLILTALIFLVLMLRIRITVAYKKDLDSDASPGVFVSVGPVKINVYPRHKKLNLKKFSAKKYRRLLAEDAKEKKKKITKKTKKDSGSSNKKKEDSLLPDSISETFDLISELLRKFTGFLRCEILTLRLNIGAKDAAATALMYSAVHSSASLIIEGIRNKADLRLHTPEDIYIKPDFDNHEIYGHIEIRFSIRIVNILRAGGGFIMYFFKKLIRIDRLKSKKSKNA